MGSKAIDLRKFLDETNAAAGNIPNTDKFTSIERHLVGAGLQGVRIIHH